MVGIRSDKLGNNEFIFSVVVPTFNRTNELKRCIQSVINQSFQGWELLIIDDRSTDNSFRIAKEWAKFDQRISFIQRPSYLAKGANICRNIGIEQSSGKYIAFLDSDDFWKEDRLQNLFRFLKNSDACSVYSGAIVVTPKDRIYKPSRSLTAEECAFDFVIASDTYAPTPSLVVERELAIKVKFNESLKRHQDYDFFIRVNEVCKWVYFESMDVVVYSNSVRPRKIDFESCARFYCIHSSISTNSSLKVAYLNYISESCAKINPSIKALSYFRSEMIKERVIFSDRQKLIFRFPRFFYLLYNVKCFFTAS